MSDIPRSAWVICLTAEDVAERAWPRELPAPLRAAAMRLASADDVTGRAGETVLIHAGDEGDEHVVLRLVLSGLGTASEVTPDLLRASGARAVRILIDHAIGKADVLLPPQRTLGATDRTEACRTWVDGVLNANYRLRKEDAPGAPTCRPLDIRFPLAGPEWAALLREAEAKADAVAFARSLATAPPNCLTPRGLADLAVAVGQETGMDVTLLDRGRLDEGGYGGILAVAAGSFADPYLVELRYRPVGAVNARRPVVFVGKCVTFDSGGLSLKPALDMDRMKADMAGGAAVLAALRCIARLGVAVEVAAVLPIVENMPGGGAMRPGDVITMHSGATVEVLNTDAEGRLILADALSRAEALDPECVIDCATLTGASAVVFGPFGMGYFCNDAELRRRIEVADRRAGEKLWPLPLWPAYETLLRSEVADLANISSTHQQGSMMTAAAFLHRFARAYPWAHLDIFNAAWSTIDHPVFGKGPTGAGTATLIEYLLARSEACP